MREEVRPFVLFSYFWNETHLILLTITHSERERLEYVRAWRVNWFWMVNMWEGRLDALIYGTFEFVAFHFISFHSLSRILMNCEVSYCYPIFLTFFIFLFLSLIFFYSSNVLLVCRLFCGNVIHFLFMFDVQCGSLVECSSRKSRNTHKFYIYFYFIRVIKLITIKTFKCHKFWFSVNGGESNG